MKPNLELDFGFYPCELDIVQGPVTISTLPNFSESRKRIKECPSVQNGWIYQRNGRVFSLPKTHSIEHSSTDDPEHLKFHIWALSFFTGMRLTTEDAGFLDTTPVEKGKLVDFVLLGNTETGVKLAENFWACNQTRGGQKQTDRFCAAVHSLFVSQNPQHLQFERFIYLYIAFDACFAILREEKQQTKQKPSHAERLKWMCKYFDIPVPAWAEGETPQVAALRNDAIHEGLFVGQPLGLAMEGDESGWNLTLEMTALACRFLVGILGVPDKNYLKSPINDRQRRGLHLT